MNGDGALDHATRDPRLGRELDRIGDVGGRAPHRVAQPGLGQIQRAANERVAVVRHVAANTPIWQLVILPAEPVYCRPTPQDTLPCLRNPVASITSMAAGSVGTSSA